MTTRAVMIAEFKKDVFRSDSDIDALAANAINAAIDQYQSQRFYFNETRDETFTTVAAQYWYSATDDAAIPKFIKLDEIFIYDNGRAVELCRMPPSRFENLTDNSAANGRPYAFTWYNQKLGLYPIPQQAYTVRMMGHIKIDAPASDSEANNVWMTEAYYLILRAAERFFHSVMTGDMQMAQIAAMSEEEALRQLRSETSRKVAGNTVCKTQW